MKLWDNIKTYFTETIPSRYECWKMMKKEDCGFFPSLEFPNLGSKMSKKEMLIAYCTWAVYMQPFLDLKEALEKERIKDITLTSIADHTDLYHIEEDGKAVPALPWSNKAMDVFSKHSRIAKLFKNPSLYMRYGDHHRYWEQVMRYEPWSSNKLDILATDPFLISANLNTRDIHGINHTQTCLLYRDIYFLKNSYTLYFLINKELFGLRTNSSDQINIYHCSQTEVDSWKETFGNPEVAFLLTPQFRFNYIGR